MEKRKPININLGAVSLVSFVFLLSMKILFGYDISWLWVFSPLIFVVGFVGIFFFIMLMFLIFRPDMVKITRVKKEPKRSF